MAWYYDEPVYVYSSPYPSYGWQQHELAPVTFREQPFYDYVYYRRDFRHHHPDSGHGGHLIPRTERVHPRREDVYVPWWQGGYPVYAVGRHQPREPVELTTVELYAPQLCCDSCERRVVESLTDMAGVENVTADQWNKKVEVLGNNLCPERLLRRLQHTLHMDRSVLWQDRRC